MELKVLDHGYVKLTDVWGSDRTVIEAARMSTAKGFQGWGTETEPGDEKLLRFLWNKGHHTPFEMCGLTIEVAAPIFVFWEWHRHRTQSYNEMSSRYTPLPDVNYIPLLSRCMLTTDSKNRQAGTIKDAAELTEEAAHEWLNKLSDLYDQIENHYKDGLEIGLPKELARVVVPVGRYSRMRASAKLRNWLDFLRLRQAPDAQWEIRQYANAVAHMIQNCFPKTWEVFTT